MALEYLKNIAGEKYTGDAHYIEEQAVRDGNIVTANGTLNWNSVAKYYMR